MSVYVLFSPFFSPLLFFLMVWCVWIRDGGGVCARVHVCIRESWCLREGDRYPDAHWFFFCIIALLFFYPFFSQSFYLFFFNKCNLYDMREGRKGVSFRVYNRSFVLVIYSTT